MFWMSQADEDGTEHGEDIRLDEGYQELQAVHEEHHHETEQGQSGTEYRIHGPSDEDDRRKRQDNGVTSHHVGKQTDHQREGLGDDTEEFDDRHDSHRISLQEGRHIGPEDLLPVLLVAEQVDGQHRTECQEERDVDVARHIGTTREDGQQTQHIGDEDEEEGRQQVGCIGTVVLLADGVLDEVVVDRHHQHLHHTYETLRHILGGVMLLVPTGTAEEDTQHDDHDDPYLQHTLGDADIPRTHTRAVGKPFVDLAVLLLVEVEAHIVLSLFHRLLDARTAEDVPLSGGFAPDDHRQRNADMLAADGGDVPLIGISEVSEHYLLHVYPLTLTGRQRCAGSKKEGEA